MQRRHFPKFLHLGRAEIADADGANLSGSVQLAHGLGDFRDRRIRVRPVHLVEIDDVGLQPPQGSLGFLDDPRLAGVAKRLAVLPVQSDLGGDVDALAPAPLGQRLADDFLGTAEAVDRRGVDQIDAAIERGVDGGDGVALVAAAPHPAADRPRPQRDPRGANGCSGNIDEFHVGVMGRNAVHGSTPAMTGRRD
jgi:hypothetical protein